MHERSVESPPDFDQHESTRRTFLKFAAASALLPLLNTLSPRAFAETLPSLEETNPVALQLSYKKTQEAAKAVEGHQEGRKCENCALYTAANKGCRLFPASSVEPNGWCKAWVPKPV